jgi:hypothetical protein
MNANEHYCIENSQANKGFKGKPGTPGKSGTPGKQGKDGRVGTKGPSGSRRLDYTFTSGSGNRLLPHGLYASKGGNTTDIVKYMIFPGTTVFGGDLSKFKIGLGVANTSNTDLSGWTFDIKVYFRSRQASTYSQNIKELLNTPLIHTKSFTSVNQDSVTPVILQTEGGNNPGVIIDTANLSTTPIPTTVELIIEPITAPDGIEIKQDTNTFVGGGGIKYEGPRFEDIRAIAEKRKLGDIKQEWDPDFIRDIYTRETINAISSLGVYLYAIEIY